MAAPSKNAATCSRPDPLRRPQRDGGGVGRDEDVGGQQLEQAGEVAAARRGQEGVDDPPVGERVLRGGRTTFARARDASLRAAASVVPSVCAIVPKAKPKLSCRTKATRSAGLSRSSTTCSARATVSASATVVGRVAPGVDVVRRSATGVGHPRP